MRTFFLLAALAAVSPVSKVYSTLTFSQLSVQDPSISPVPKKWWWDHPIGRKGDWWSWVSKNRTGNPYSAVRVTLHFAGIQDPVDTQIPSDFMKESFEIPFVNTCCFPLEPRMRGLLIGAKVEAFHPEGNNCVEIYHSVNCTGPHFKGSSFTNHYPNLYATLNLDTGQWEMMPFFYAGSLRSCSTGFDDSLESYNSRTMRLRQS